MVYERVIREAERIAEKYNTKDPFLLCREMDIILLFQPLGSGANAIKGFYFESCRIGTITINSDLPPSVQKVIAAHELGHRVLHRSGEMYFFQETGLFNCRSQAEKEANIFAAELLVPDKDAIELLKSGRDFFSAAAALNVPPELLDFKIRAMKSKGYSLPESPILSENGFLKKIGGEMSG